MSRRGLAVAAVAAATLAAAGCGSSADKNPPLAWDGSPVAYQPPNLPTDRVVLAKVRNASAKPITLEAAKLVVRDADDKVLKSSGRYIAGYAHGLYGAFQKPDPLPPDELRRLGLKITLQPGKTAPIALAWRLTKGAKTPAHVDYGTGTLKLPVTARPGS